MQNPIDDRLDSTRRHAVGSVRPAAPGRILGQDAGLFADAMKHATRVNSQPAAADRGLMGRSPLRIAFVLFAFTLAAACEAPESATQSQAGGDAAAKSRSGRFHISVAPRDPRALRSSLHDWVVTISRVDGTPAAVDQVFFDGGMPAHGHGFVTAPRVTRSLGEGRYLVEGVKFHMPGAWEIRVGVRTQDGPDEAVVRITVEP